MPYDGEYIDIDNVSEGEEDDLPAPRVMAPPVPSPMQTATSTIYSTQVDPLAMGARAKQPKSTADITYSGSRNCPHVLTFFTIYDIV
jgi:hypothetical protein